MAEVVHRVEQAWYWGMLKQQLNSTGLSEQGKASLEKQLEDCAKLLQSPPPASMLAMVQAACEDQV